ncbi:MAG: hypothetical protein WAX04_12790 [Oscillospiraceae bacterium]
MFNKIVNEDGLRRFFATGQKHMADYSVETEEEVDYFVNGRSMTSQETNVHTSDKSSSLERAIKAALKMYDCGSYTIAEITNKTGISKSGLYGALAERILDI